MKNFLYIINCHLIVHQLCARHWPCIFTKYGYSMESAGLGGRFEPALSDCKATGRTSADKSRGGCCWGWVAPAQRAGQPQRLSLGGSRGGRTRGDPEKPEFPSLPLRT